MKASISIRYSEYRPLVINAISGLLNVSLPLTKRINTIIEISRNHLVASEDHEGKFFHILSKASRHRHHQQTGAHSDGQSY